MKEHVVSVEFTSAILLGSIWATDILNQLLLIWKGQLNLGSIGPQQNKITAHVFAALGIRNCVVACCTHLTVH